MVLGRGAGNLNKAFITVMRHCGAHPNDCRPIETSLNVFNLYALRCSTEIQNPLASDFFAFLGRILIKIIYSMNTGRNNSTNQPLESDITGTIENASCSLYRVLLETNIIMPAILLNKVQIRRFLSYVGTKYFERS
jgi:hypothetical protein